MGPTVKITVHSVDFTNSSLQTPRIPIQLDMLFSIPASLQARTVVSFTATGCCAKVLEKLLKAKVSGRHGNSVLLLKVDGRARYMYRRYGPTVPSLRRVDGVHSHLAARVVRDRLAVCGRCRGPCGAGVDRHFMCSFTPPLNEMNR